MWTVPAVELTAEERVELERRVRAHTSSQRMAKRARVILLCAEGVSLRQVGLEVGMDQHQVGVWRRRFESERLAGLEDRPRTGRPRVYSHDDRVKIVATATSEVPDTESHWSHRLLAETLAEEVGISGSQIGRILAEMDVRPHKMRSWLNRRDDPEFWERASDVCGLYLSPPQNALVLSVDEKTAVPARSPRYPTKPAEPGRPARREFEYRRHGTASFIAALDVVSGEVLAGDVDRNTAANFIDFLDGLDRNIDPALEVHLVMDNGSSHVAKATRAWLAEHPRFVAHYTPKHASWLNQIELFFSILTRRLLKRGEFGSRDELVSRVMDFIRAHNQHARPFAWTYAGTPLKTA